MRLIKRFWPIIFIFIVWLIFSSPYFLKGRVPYASTYQVNFFSPWSAYSKFSGPVKNNAMPDVITQIYPWKHFTIQTLKEGLIPLWNPYSFSGTPHLANYQSAVLSPFNILFFIFPFIDAWSILVLLQPLLAGLFMYMLARSLDRSKIGCLIASLSFMFCGFITVWMGYATLGYAILFLPLSIFSIEKYYQTNNIKFLVLLSITIPLSFFSGHFQISTYFLAFVSVYIIYKLLLTKSIRATFYLSFYIFFGILLSMPQILPSIEFYLQSLRSSLFLKGEVIPGAYLPTFLSPDFFGNPVTRNDWFGHYAEWNGYIGVLPIMLAIYSILSKKRIQTLFLFIFGVFILLLAFNTPLLTLLINLHIPVISTSAASRVIVIYSFIFALISSFGYDHLMVDIKDGKVQKIVCWLGFFLLLFLFLWLIVVLKLFMPAERLIIARQNLILPTLLCLSSSAVILSAVVISKLKKRPAYLISAVSCILVLIVAFDMLRFATKWQPFDPKRLVFPNVKTTREFRKISGNARVLGNFGAEASVYYKLPALEGYDALYIKRYGEFISALGNGKIQEASRSVVAFPKDGRYSLKAVNLLGVKYIVHKVSDDHASWTFPFWSHPHQFKLIYKDGLYQVYENKNAYPRSFLVDDYKIIHNKQRIIDTIFSNNFNSRKEVVLEENPGIAAYKSAGGSAQIVSYNGDYVKIKTKAKVSSLLFLSDNYYPGWKANVDGKQTKIYRADYTFRAVKVPKGSHTVNFIYDPFSFKLGVFLAMLGVIGIITLGFVPRILVHLRSFSFSRSQKDI